MPVPYHLTTMWVSHLYQKSATDGVLFNQRDDFGELINVDPSTGASKHIVLYAPLKVLQKKKEQLIDRDISCNEKRIV